MKHTRELTRIHGKQGALFLVLLHLNIHIHMHTLTVTLQVLG